MTPGLRRVIKPAIEVMGALPTVVIGLVAGIWLAPIIEQYLLAVLALPLLLAAAVLLCGALTHRFMPRCRPGVDLLLLLPLLALTVWLALSWGRGWRWRCSVSRCISGWGIITTSAMRWWWAWRWASRWCRSSSRWRRTRCSACRPP